MADMPEKYELRTNNCQCFVLKLADLICRNGRKTVFTSWSLTTRQLGFIPGSEDENAKLGEEVEVAFVENGDAHFAQLEEIEKIMQEYTPTVTEEELKAGKLDPPKGALDGMPDDKLKAKDEKKV
jgi:hypothetical protein